jgi:hypothetical protein
MLHEPNSRKNTYAMTNWFAKAIVMPVAKKSGMNTLEYFQ